MTIEQWLDEFKKYWLQKEIDSVIDLFTSDVEYWENPYKKLNSVEELRSEWDVINTQSDIDFGYEIFSRQDDLYSVRWKLSYRDENSTTYKWAGVYQIRLNNDGKCNYFYQVGERAEE
jgi:hypothetical protein